MKLHLGEKTVIYRFFCVDVAALDPANLTVTSEREIENPVPLVADAISDSLNFMPE